MSAIDARWGVQVGAFADPTYARDVAQSAFQHAVADQLASARVVLGETSPSGGQVALSREAGGHYPARREPRLRAADRASLAVPDRAAGWVIGLTDLLLGLCRKQQRKSLLARGIHRVRRLRLGHVARARRRPRRHHAGARVLITLRGRRLAQAEFCLQHFHDEEARREIVIDQDDLVPAWAARRAVRSRRGWLWWFRASYLRCASRAERLGGMKLSPPDLPAFYRSVAVAAARFT